jgi:adenylate kinase
MNIVFMGPAGSGKGTQSVLLSEYLKVPHISIGSLLKNEVRKETEFGNKVNAFIKKGKMVPDELVIPFLKERIIKKDCDNGFILDGFPRNLNQAIFLDKELKSIDKKIDKVFVIDISDEVVIKRTTGRFKCNNCGTRYNKYYKKLKDKNKCDICGSSDFVRRADDITEDIIKERIKVYKEKTKKAIDYYNKKGLIITIDGVNSVESIFLKIKSFF